MSAPTISEIGSDTPNEGRVKINASLNSLKDNTVWRDPPSAQTGLISVGEVSATNYITTGGSPAAAGAVRLTNTNEIRWAYGGNDVFRMRNNGLTWDLSIIVGGTPYALFSIVGSVVLLPYPATFGAQATFAEISAPDAPASGYSSLYAKNGGLCLKDDAGVEYNMGMYSRGAGLPDVGATPEGTIRYNETTEFLYILVNGAWKQLP